MTDLVSIAGGAVAAYQRALGTVSNNIANVDSAGYTRQEASLIENAPRSYGTSYLGTGVNVLGIKRMYDAFIENSLRNANTELGTQESVVDILGSEDVGLLSAFDQFFDAARQLATDSSSVILREQFISKADALASRFTTLNSQLTLVAQETQEAIRSEVSSLNSLSEQLTLVNTQLGKTKLLSRQPPALMDQRDEILRQMASLAKLNVTEMQNGQVKVALGASSTRGEIVSLTDFRPLTAVFNASSVGKVDLVIDAGSPRAESLIGFSGGTISGLLGFRSQLLEPAFEELNSLAKTLLSSVNEIHAEGIDLEGREGGDLFQIDPSFSLKASAGETDIRVAADVVDLKRFQANQLRLDYRSNAGQTNSIALSGEYRAGDQFTVNLNGSEKRFALTGASDGEVISLAEVQTQLRNFLEGGNGSSVGGAFGLQIDARNGAGTDLLVSSTLLGAFNLSVTTTSDTGRIDESVSRGLWTATYNWCLKLEFKRGADQITRGCS
jgi:flagellar hook-associated protein FlgK